MEEISRDDVETMGQSLGEEEVMPRVIALRQGLDDTRAQVIRVDQEGVI